MLGKLMKNIRRFLFCGLAAAVCCMWSGCATTQSYEQQMRARDEKAAWDQLTACEKAGIYCGWWMEAVLYGMGSSGASFRP